MESEVEVACETGPQDVSQGFDLRAVVRIEISGRAVVDEASEILHVLADGGIVVNHAHREHPGFPFLRILVEGVPALALAHAEPACVHDGVEDLARKQSHAALGNVASGKPFEETEKLAVFRIMKCRDIQRDDVNLTETQKRAVVKRIADVLEKLGVAGLAVGIFQGNNIGTVVGIAFVFTSVALLTQHRYS